MERGTQFRGSSPGHERGGFGQAVSWRMMATRRCGLALASRFASRRFFFALAALSVIGSKLVHVYTHLSALPSDSLRWGYTFFAQDMILIIILRLLLDEWLFSAQAVGKPRLTASIAATVFVALITSLGIMNISFFVVAGSEIHWRNISVAGDASGRALLLSGLVYFVLVVFAIVFLSWALQDALFVAAGFMADIVTWPTTFLARSLQRVRIPLPSRWKRYSQLPQQDVETATKFESFSEGQSLKYKVLSATADVLDDIRTSPRMWLFKLVAYGLAAAALLAQLIMSIMRPHDSAAIFMSWTPALLPFVDLKPSSPNLQRLVPVYGTGIDRDWDDLTALSHPISLPWLPKNSVPDGFEDWYDGKQHYNASADPLKISNLEDDVLPDLRNKLKDVPIRHVMLIALESTRKDLFPFKKDGLHWERLKEEWNKHKVPKDVLERLKTLTPTAKYLTGDYDDGFERKNETQKKRGGINFNDAYTTATYTLKSLTGILCGVSPLVADFNLEYLHHIYQPCLPQIFDALNTIDHGDASDFNSYKWKSAFMQSVTLNFDHFGELMRKIGFPEDGLIDKEYLKSDDAKFGKVTLSDINYFGMQETPLEDYFRDAFSSAEENNERVFLTHITSTSHHPFAMPENETYVELANGMDDLSHYINAIGYDDRWLAQVLDLLDKQGVANETLVILLGDHGLSIPENDVVSSYYNPNIGSTHVPMVISHPMMPPITIDNAVSSQQILPTILDLLIETDSLSDPGTQAAKDLVRNYEGQSLIRPVRKSKTFGKAIDESTLPTSTEVPTSSTVANWHFTAINPGRAMLGIRDARHNDWRLVVPTVDNNEWRFTDIIKDPREAKPVLAFEFSTFLKKVEEEHGEDAARWVEEAAFVTRWWVEENNKRWRYGLRYAS
ncbi:sulfatase [Mariannaea sp. PMI_226]|nr:sulfatase [Mariannaea sp. PMI_226]